MSLAVHIALGVFFGALGALFHLAVTARRARMVVGGRRRIRPMLAYPLGLCGPGLAVLAAAALSPETAWSVPIGILALRAVILRRVTAS